MKTFIKTLYYKEYESPIAYGYEADHKVKSYVEIKVGFDFREGLRFCVTVPNVSYTYHNPFKAIMKALEHESIGMSKYNRIKEDTRRCGLWKKLDCK